jgi:hypothetical protein
MQCYRVVALRDQTANAVRKTPEAAGCYDFLIERMTQERDLDERTTSNGEASDE